MPGQSPTSEPHAPDPLTIPAPALDDAAVVEVAEGAFGVRGSITPLGGERDQNLRIDVPGAGSYLLKVSNPADGPDALDLQTQALLHVARQDPDLPVMEVVPAVDGAPWVSVRSSGGIDHLVRLFTFVPGRPRSAEELDHPALHAYGSVVGRMGRALRGFFHPAARYEILWDLRHAGRLRPLLASVRDAERRALAERVLDRFEARVAPVFEGLRAQVIHNDLTLDNVLLGDDLRVSGVVDLGDLTHTALVGDLAIALAGLMWRRRDPIETAESVIAGHAGVVPLEDDEAWLLADLVATRLTAWGVIAAWRAAGHPDNAAYITSGEDDAWQLLGTLEAIGLDVVARRFRSAAVSAAAPYRSMPTAELAGRRSEVLGSSPLAYRDPLHLTSGAGVWLFDRDGRRYLDAYNNVPVVGHANPAVVTAVAGQARLLATNTRYLHEAAVALGERLAATMPPELDTVVLVNSGSEANDLAWRLATAVTGRRGALVSERAYHGVTTATTALSPEVWPAGYRPDHVETFAPPSGPAGAEAVGQALSAASSALAARHLAPAALFIDPAFTSDGILAPPTAALHRLAEGIRTGGGLLVVDEVQSGHGRCGADLWAFRACGLVPDIVTLGKPMGNGHPVAAVVTTARIAATLMDRMELFSTFGGNPVSCVAALAVLDVIEREGLVQQAERVGDHLRTRLQELAAVHDALGEVRGSGLLVGVELVRGEQRPATGALGAAVVEGMRARGVLIGATGRYGNVLKIRPPLVFESSHAEQLVETLHEALRST